MRHRLLFAAVQTLPNLKAQHLFKDKNILHFAPESFFSRFLAKQTKYYVSADPFRSDVSVQIDMCNMKDIENGSFDVVIACDVLEHVPDDTVAIREIHRVLADGGWVILTVPQKDGLETKYEDAAITTPEERKRVFGQEDHLRIYGNDFNLFLESHGFTVTVINGKSFDPEMVQKHVLFPPVLSEHPLATNHRSVYFGQKNGLGQN
ncbi:MAG: methyltransferase domain-containing protein [Cyanobacteria bacterium P01_D01_bin.2]